MPADPKPAARAKKRLAFGSTLAAPTKPIAAMSDKRAAEYEVRNLFAPQMREQDCIVKVRGGFTVPECSGIATVHEPWTRARGGPIDDPRNAVPCCAFHNTWLSQTVAGQRWGEANGMLISAVDGAAWLKAGGVNQ